MEKWKRVFFFSSDFGDSKRHERKIIIRYQSFRHIIHVYRTNFVSISVNIWKANLQQPHVLTISHIRIVSNLSWSQTDGFCFLVVGLDVFQLFRSLFFDCVFFFCWFLWQNNNVLVYQWHVAATGSRLIVT